MKKAIFRRIVTPFFFPSHFPSGNKSPKEKVTAWLKSSTILCGKAVFQVTELLKYQFPGIPCYIIVEIKQIFGCSNSSAKNGNRIIKSSIISNKFK